MASSLMFHPFLFRMLSSLNDFQVISKHLFMSTLNRVPKTQTQINFITKDI